jgi:hypothetical protein
MRKFGVKTTVVSLIAIAISFGLNELMLMNPDLAMLLPVAALPATLPIFVGWLPVIGVKTLIDRRNAPKQKPLPEPAQPTEPSSTIETPSMPSVAQP